MLGEAERSEPAEGTGVGGEKDDRVRGAHALARGSAGLCVPARELHQSGCAARVVVRAGAGPGVVAVRHHDDRIGGLSGRDRPQVAQPDAPEPGHVRVPGVRRQGQAVRRELVAQPLFGAQRSRPAGNTVGIVARELGRQLPGRRPVEVGRQERRRQRSRPGDAEGEDQERQQENEQRTAVQPSVDRAFE